MARYTPITKVRPSLEMEEAWKTVKILTSFGKGKSAKKEYHRLLKAKESRKEEEGYRMKIRELKAEEKRIRATKTKKAITRFKGLFG